jgi:carbamoyltransferase
VLVNTSFNVRGEPIVCTPRGRVPLLHGHGDETVLVVGNCLLRKEQKQEPGA